MSDTAGDHRNTRSPSRRARGAPGVAGAAAGRIRAAVIRAIASAIVILSVPALAACGDSESGAADTPVATDRVLMPPHYRFDPQVITVEVGDTVTWVNRDDFTHSVRLEGEEDRRVAPGDSVTIVFTRPGEHPYDCSFHPHDMSGRVIVDG